MGAINSPSKNKYGHYLNGKLKNGKKQQNISKGLEKLNQYMLRLIKKPALKR
jgi:hypothetical protein